MEDTQIIDLYFERSENAISETDIKYGAYCHTIAYNVLQNTEDSDECRNDTYLKVWNSIPPTRPSHFKAFIGKITRNLAIDMYNKYHAQKRNSGSVDLALDELAECISDNSNPYKAEDSVVTECLNAFLRSLPTDTRSIFIRRYWQMSSTADIAAALNMKESTVRVSLKRTRDKLKAYFLKEGIYL